MHADEEATSVLAACRTRASRFGAGMRLPALRTRLAGVAVLGSAVVSAGAVAVGAARLFECGFRRRGAGLLAACSIAGSDSRRLLRPARGLRAARFGVFPDDPHALRDLSCGLVNHGLRVLPVHRGLAFADPAISIRSTMRSPPVDNIATVMAMRTARPMANLMASCLDW